MPLCLWVPQGVCIFKIRIQGRSLTHCTNWKIHARLEWAWPNVTLQWSWLWIFTDIVRALLREAFSWRHERNASIQKGWRVVPSGKRKYWYINACDSVLELSIIINLTLSLPPYRKYAATKKKIARKGIRKYFSYVFFSPGKATLSYLLCRRTDFFTWITAWRPLTLLLWINFCEWDVVF